ncbi:electron transfer flavoprotein subunit alpha/FixB family protein [Pseudomonas sp. NY15181]|uniref:electron transfer flavoprotein subunit alpha/FixB family protein n=1 Tax=Pseudomonas sp. NY15181 TaxID=3400349 RepID=UPI003A86FF2A
MTVLVVADHNNVAIADDVAKVVSAARKIDSDVHVLIAGKGSAPAAEQASKLEGVSKVLLAENELLDSLLAEATAELIVSLSSSYQSIVASASSNGKSILPRVAALLDVMQISEVIAVISSDTFARPIYAGNAIQTVRSNDSKKVLTVRPTAFSAAAATGSAVIEPIQVSLGEQSTKLISNALSTSERPGLASARVVVAGGRALGSADKFNDLLAPFADKLGAAIGASRAAVDAGYAPNDWQIGQTGKIVAPELYFALGISGAIQHLAGMTGSKIIVAINKDEEAPIFQVADYGLVGDIFELVPELQKAL